MGDRPSAGHLIWFFFCLRNHKSSGIYKTIRKEVYNEMCTSITDGASEMGAPPPHWFSYYVTSVFFFVRRYSGSVISSVTYYLTDDFVYWSLQTIFLMLVSQTESFLAEWSRIQLRSNDGLNSDVLHVWGQTNKKEGESSAKLQPVHQNKVWKWKELINAIMKERNPVRWLTIKGDPPSWHQLLDQDC